MLPWNAAHRAPTWGWERISHRGSECSLQRKGYRPVSIWSFFNSVFPDGQMTSREKLNDILSCCCEWVLWEPALCAQQGWGPRSVGYTEVELKGQESVTNSGVLDVTAVI